MTQKEIGTLIQKVTLKGYVTYVEIKPLFDHVQSQQKILDEVVSLKLDPDQEREP